MMEKAGIGEGGSGSAGVRASKPGSTSPGKSGGGTGNGNRRRSITETIAEVVFGVKPGATVTENTDPVAGAGESVKDAPTGLG